ncbi:MAG TPA: sulfotransferase family 2 domain-containing protein [Caulobacteraceae bacterium]
MMSLNKLYDAALTGAADDRIIKVVVPSQRIVWLGIPKNASASISRALVQHYGLDAIPCDLTFEALWRLNPEIEDFQVVAIKRNPYTRVVSAWLNKIAASAAYNDRYRRIYPNLRPGTSFPEFASWLNSAEGSDDRADQHWRSQYDMLARADKIVAFEDLPDCVSLLGLYPSILPHRNQHTEMATFAGLEARPLLDWYDDEALKNISRRYARDIEMLGYETPQLGKRAPVNNSVSAVANDADEQDGSSTTAFAHVQQDLVAAAQQVRQRIEAHYEHLLRTDPEGAADYHRRLTPMWKDKYLDRAPEHIAKWAELLEHLDGFRQGYEIGVGPGSLFRLLTDLKQVAMRGCDTEPDETIVFRELRKQLGIAELVDAHAVQRRTPMPIAEGTDALLGFYTTFSKDFSVPDWEWLFDYCRERMVGDKLVYLIPNPKSYNQDGVAAFFRQRAEFPLLDIPTPGRAKQWHEKTFLRLSLA